MNTIKKKKDKYKYEEQDGELIAIPTPEWEKYRIKKKQEFMFKNSGIPVEYKDFTFNKFEKNIIQSKDSIEKCKKYAMNALDSKYRGVNLFLWGINTAGKSSIACAIAHEFIKQNCTVKFRLAGDLVADMIEAISWNAENDVRKRLREFDGVDLAIIDDAFDEQKSLLYKGDSKNQMVQALDTFFRRHISDNTRFIITSNIAPVEIANKYSLSIYELIDRNFIILDFKDELKQLVKSKFTSIFD